MNFLTAEVQVVVDYSKLSAQLDKVKQQVVKSAVAMEKSYYRQDKAIETVNKTIKTSNSLWVELFRGAQKGLRDINEGWKNLRLDARKAIRDMIEEWKNLNLEVDYGLENWRSKNLFAVAEMKKAFSELEGTVSDTGIKLRDIGSVVVDVYKRVFGKILNAAKWAFGGILGIVETVWRSVFRVTKWRATGITAILVGMYYTITKAAIKAEDKLAGGFGVTSVATQRLKDAITGVAAAIGKPFLRSIVNVSTALSKWLEKSTPQFQKWAEKIAGFITDIQNGFIDWVTFLTTDFKGGVDVALAVIIELFKTFGDILVITVKDIGYKVGKALVTGIADGLKYVVESSLDKVKDIINKEIDASRELLNLGISAFPPTGNVPYTRRDIAPARKESSSEKIAQRVKESAAAIANLLKGMPTWGDAAAEATDRVTAATKKATAVQVVAYEDALAGAKAMIETLDFEYGLIGKTIEAREYALEMQRFQQELNEIENLTLEDKNILTETYSEKLERNLDLQRQLNDELDKSLTGWAAVGDAISIWMKRAGDWGKTLGQIITNTFDRMADGLADALMGMEMDWKAFGRMFIKQLLAMIIQMQILYVWQLLTGSAGAGAGAAPTQATGINPTASPVSLQHGGEGTRTGWAKVHEGERYSGVDNEQGFGNTVVNINDFAGLDVEVDEYKDSDQRIIDVSLMAAAGNGTYRRVHRIS